MKDSLLKILRCPIEKAELTLKDQVYEKEEIKSGNLVCNKCGTKYAIINFIPVMLTNAEQFQSMDSVNQWGFQWHAEEFMVNTIYYEKDFLKVEYDEWNLPENWLNGKKILDAGCGNGRHSLILKWFDYEEVVAFDLSDSVYYMLHKPEFENIHLVRADMANPPFPYDYFDMVLARQVLQHTKNPSGSIKSLTKVLKKGGYFIGSLYKTPEKFLTLFKLRLIGAIRWFLQLFPSKVIYYFTWLSIPMYKYKIFYPLARLIFIQSKYDKTDDFTWCLNHDQYITSYQYTFTRDEAVSYFKEAGLDDLVESAEWENLFRSTKVR